MRPFSTSMFRQVEFCPASWPTRSSPGRGDARPTYPGTGTTVWACPQRQSVTELAPDGTPLAATVHNVMLRDDPSALNGGAGVKKGDAFRDRGRLLVAESDAVPGTQANAPWKVVCKEVR